MKLRLSRILLLVGLLSCIAPRLAGAQLYEVVDFGALDEGKTVEHFIALSSHSSHPLTIMRYPSRTLSRRATILICLGLGGAVLAFGTVALAAVIQAAEMERRLTYRSDG